MNARDKALQEHGRAFLTAILMGPTDDVLLPVADDFGDQGVFAVLYGFASEGLRQLSGANEDDGMVFGLQVECGNGHTIEDQPPGVRCSARFLTAAGNDDVDMALLMFHEAGRIGPDEGLAFLDSVVHTVADVWRAIYARHSARGAS